MTRGGAQQLHHHVDRHGMDVGAQPLGMVQAPIGPQKVENAQEGFLADVLDQLPGAKTVAHRQPDHVAEMGHKVPLGLGVAGTEARQVGSVKDRLAQ